MSDFPCDSCGLCCQNIGHIKELKVFDRGDGVCIHFDSASKLCKIYKDRPLICRVEQMYQSVYSEFMTKERFYKLNQDVCKYLKDQNKE